MTANPLLVAHGTVNGTAINVDMSRVEHSAVKYVTLSSNYVIAHPPGGLNRPAFTGAAVANLDYPRTILAGTRLALIAAEAAALVAAGAAAYS